MESSVKSSDMDLINFLYRSYSTLKNEYLISKQEHDEERDFLLKTIARLQQHDHELLDTLKELRMYCDRLLTEREELLNSNEHLTRMHMASSQESCEKLPNRIPSTSEANEDRQTDNADLSLADEHLKPHFSGKHERNFDLIQQLRDEMAQMRNALHQTVGTQEEMKHLKALLLEQSQEIATLKESQELRKPDSPVTDQKED